MHQSCSVVRLTSKLRSTLKCSKAAKHCFKLYHNEYYIECFRLLLSLSKSLQGASSHFKVLPTASKHFCLLSSTLDCFQAFLIAFKRSCLLPSAPVSLQALLNASKCSWLLPSASICFQVLLIAPGSWLLPSAFDCFQLSKRSWSPPSALDCFLSVLGTSHFAIAPDYFQALLTAFERPLLLPSAL